MMNKVKHILYGFFVVVMMPVMAKNDVGNSVSQINIKDIPRINGELDFSKIHEIVLKSIEKTQLTGRFGVIAARIEDLVNVPEFITFRPVVVIGKVTYRRDGTSYICHVQWEKVCLIAPAFNKVRRLDKGLISRFNHSGGEITRDFLMTARGDIPTFIKNVKELFNAPVATDSDLSDKEKEKLNELHKSQLKDVPSGGAGTHSTSEKNKDLKGKNEAARAHPSEQKEGDLNSDAKIPTGQNSGNSSGEKGLEQKGVPTTKDKDQEKQKKAKSQGTVNDNGDPSRRDGEVPQVKVSSGYTQPNEKGSNGDSSGSGSGVGTSDGRKQGQNASAGTGGKTEDAGGDSHQARRDREMPHVKVAGRSSSSGRGQSDQENGSDASTGGSSNLGDSRAGGQYGSNHASSPGTTARSNEHSQDGTRGGASSGGASDAAADRRNGVGDYMNVTTEGCTIRVDLDQLRAIQQERLIVRRNGQEDRSSCKDGSTVFTIHKNYDHPYKVDVPAGKAYPQYSYYYLDSTGRRKTVRIEGREIETDMNSPVVLQETEEGCQPTPEYGRDSTTMIKCKRKFYIKHSGEKEFATQCLGTGIKAKVEWTTEGCEVEHILAARKSFIKKRRVYKFPGDEVATEYSRCERENREPIPHMLEACEPEVENGKWFERNRTEIRLNGRNVVIRPCERVSSNGTALEKEYNSTYSHLDDKSHPYVRKYYMYNGEKHYAAGLEVDLTVSYPHQKRVLSYEYKDNEKKAIPIEQYFFKGVNNREVDVRVAPGDPIGYVNTQESEIKVEGAPTYEGCHKITRQSKYLKWKRPDGTFFYEKANTEEPIREYVCQTEYVREKNVLKTTYRYKNSPRVVGCSRACGDTPSGDRYTGDNRIVIIEATGNKSLEEMQQISHQSEDERIAEMKRNARSYRSDLWIRNDDGHHIEKMIIRTIEEVTYAIQKLNGKNIGNRSFVSKSEYDQTELIIE